MQAGTGARILVVDDHSDNRDLLRRRLERRGYQTVGAADGRVALELVRHGAQSIDAVLLDINMPRMSGLEVLAELRKDHSLVELPVIMVTARDRSKDVVGSLAAGASDYVSKPIDFPVLLARLKTWLQLKDLHDTREHFLRIASHDLRNPLTQVLTSVDFVTDDIKPGQVLPPDMHAMLVGVLDAAERMRVIIEAFVDLNALRDGQLRLDLRPQVVDDLLDQVAQRHKHWSDRKQIDLAVQPGCGRTRIQADRARIEQVLDNLVSNALKFSPTGTSIVLRSRLDDDHAVIEVSDQGPGVAPADRARLFQRYARLGNRPTAGEASTGLGLSIAKEIVHLHGGEIGLRDDTTSGSTFFIRLPVVGS